MIVPGYIPFGATDPASAYPPKANFAAWGWAPEVSAYSLLPGEACPCQNVVISPQIESRNFRVEYTQCPGDKYREIVTIYTKDEWDGVSDEESWNNAWEEITHVERWEIDGGATVAAGEVWNLGRSDERMNSIPCGLLEKSVDQWEPGPLEDNPGSATYTFVATEEETPFPPVGAPSALEFEGPLDVGGSHAVVSISDDSDTSSLYATQWRWVIDLTNWPTPGADWPARFTIRGTIVWWKCTKSHPNSSPGVDLGNGWANTWDECLREQESFSLNAAQKRWEGVLRTTMPDGAVSAGNTIVVANLAPPQDYLFLPGHITSFAP